MCEERGMKSLVIGALATLNLLCCSSFAEAVVANNIKVQSKTSQTNVLNNTFAQTITPTSLNTQFANFLPSDAPLVAMVDTSSATWRKAGNFQLFQTAWNRISFLIPSQLKNGSATDIEPWLGEQVAFAFLPKDSSSEVTIESNFVALAPVKDEEGLQKFLKKLKAGGNLNQRQYKGITILETKPGLSGEDNTIPPVPKSPVNKANKPNIFKKPNLRKQSSLAIGILPGHLAVASSTKAIEKVINTSRQKAATLA